MVGDRGPVAGSAVPYAAQPGGAGGRGRAGAERAEAGEGGDQAGPVGGGRPRRLDPLFADSGPQGAQGGAEVARDVEVAGDVRLGQAEFPGLPQESAQRPAVAEHHGGRGRGSGLAAVPGPDAEGRGAVEEPVQQGARRVAASVMRGCPS